LTLAAVIGPSSEERDSGIMAYRLRSALTAVACLAVGTMAMAQERSAFVKGDDLWVFLGDSITHNDTYRRTVERVFRHYHPQTPVRFVQAGTWGALATASQEQFQKAAKNQRPTIVSLMTGMNNSINTDWRLGQPMDTHLAAYRKQIADFAKAAKANGVEVLLMSPTLTDESLGWSSMWALGGTGEFLRKCGAIVKEVAKEQGVHYIPVGEEFEDGQKQAMGEQVFRADGVHPTALGQYAIARSLIRRMSFDASAEGGARALAEPAEELPVRMTLASRFLAEQDRKIDLRVKADAPMVVKATWSFRDVRKTQELKLSGEDTFTLELPEGALKMDVGAADDIVIDVTDGKRSSLFLIDLCRTRVLHLKDNQVSGVIKGEAKDSEGKKQVDWTLSVVDGKWLLLEAEVFDAEICTESEWPWGQDGLSVWMDYRPDERFADIGVDADVYMTMLLPYEKPRFGVSLRPWLGRGICGPGVAGGVKTAGGYKAHLSVADQKGQFHRFSKWADSDLSKRDYFGFDIIHTDLNMGKDGKPTATFTPLLKTQNPHDKYANTLVIVDLKNKLKGDSITNVHLSRL
jgi:lysophospholipase L1-like esterase